MLKIWSIIALFAISATEFAQEEETLLSSDFHSGGYGGPELKLTQINGDWGLMVGGRGGWIIDHTFSIGGGGYGLVTSHELVDYNPKNPRGDGKAYLRAGWGGLFLEYINSSDKAIHFTVNTLIGGGGAAITPSWTDMAEHENEHDINEAYETSGFFVIEPGISADFNMTSFMRIGLSASYRFISGVDFSDRAAIDNSDLSGASVNLIFKFGAF